MIVNDCNKDLESIYCGKQLIGNPKKMQLLKRLHLKKCDICKDMVKQLNAGKANFIQIDLSEDKRVLEYMNKGLNCREAYRKIEKESNKLKIYIKTYIS